MVSLWRINSKIEICALCIFYKGDCSGICYGCCRILKGTDYLIFGSKLFMESVFDLALKSADWQLCISLSD